VIVGTPKRTTAFSFLIDCGLVPKTIQYAGRNARAAYHTQYLNEDVLDDAEERKIVAAPIAISTGVTDLSKLPVPEEVGRRLLKCYERLGDE